jgi:MFS family permease
VHLSRHGIRNPDEAGPARDGGWHALLRDRRLLVFSVSIALFAVASAGVLQVAAVETNARLGTRSGLVIAAFLILPQIVVAVVSPSIARSAENQGRRPVLLAGFATLPLRGALFALLQSSYALILVQTLEGFGGAVFGVMLSLVAADLTRPTGYYNLCLSILGLAAGLGTTLSAMMVGFTFDRFGGSVALWVLAACGALAFGFVALTMPASPR